MDFDKRIKGVIISPNISPVGMKPANFYATFSYGKISNTLTLMDPETSIKISINLNDLNEIIEIKKLKTKIKN